MVGPPPRPSAAERAAVIHDWKFWDDGGNFRPCVLLTWHDLAGRPEFEVALSVEAVAAIDSARAAADERLRRSLRLNDGCAHLRIGLYRVGPHVAELCDDCGSNFRGAGRWVSKAELVGIEVAVLPASPFRVKEKVAEPDLFAGEP